MALTLGLLVCVFIGTAGYTMALQRLFRALVKPASPGAATGAPRYHALVLLWVYLGRLNVAFALGMLVYFVARQQADWRVGVFLLLLCTLGGHLLSQTWLGPRTPWMLAALTAELKRQHTFYSWLGKPR